MVPLGIELFDVASVKQNFSSQGVVKSFQKRNDRGLSASTSATKSNNTILLVVNTERHTLEHFNVCLSGVNKFNIPELDTPINLPFNLVSTFLVNFRNSLHNRDNFIGGTYDGSKVSESVGHHLKLESKHYHVEKELRHFTDGNFVVLV